MAVEERFHQFQLTPEDLDGPTPERVRDTILRCCLEAQGQTLSWAVRGTSNAAAGPGATHAVKDMMAGIFLEVGVDFDHPSKEGLAKILRVCSDMARSWGTPEEVVLHNRNQIQRLVDLL